MSWGKGCGVPNQPGVYADVAFYVEWIERKIHEKKTSFEWINQITLEKNVADNETCKRNGDSSVGILVMNVCVFCVHDV